MKRGIPSTLCLALLGAMSLGADCDLYQKACPEPEPDNSYQDLLDDLLDDLKDDLFGDDD